MQQNGFKVLFSMNQKRIIIILSLNPVIFVTEYKILTNSKNDYYILFTKTWTSVRVICPICSTWKQIITAYISYPHRFAELISVFLFSNLLGCFLLQFCNVSICFLQVAFNSLVVYKIKCYITKNISISKYFYFKIFLFIS